MWIYLFIAGKHIEKQNMYDGNGAMDGALGHPETRTYIKIE